MVFIAVRQEDKRIDNTVVEGKCELETKIVNEYDQEIPQSQTADNPVAP